MGPSGSDESTHEFRRCSHLHSHLHNHCSVQHTHFARKQERAEVRKGTTKYGIFTSAQPHYKSLRTPSIDKNPINQARATCMHTR